MNRTLSVALSLMIVAAAQGWAEPAAVLLSASGPVETAADATGPWRPVRVGQGFEPGNVVRVAGGEAVLFWSDARSQTVRAPATVRIEPNARGRRSGGALGRLWDALVKRARLAMTRERLFSDAGAVRALPSFRIDLSRPRNTSVLEFPRQVVWAAVSGVETYRVTLSDANGSVLWTGLTSSPGAELPAARIPAERGAYYFLVVSDSQTAGTGSGKAYFRVLPEASKKAVDEDVAAIEREFPAGSAGRTLAVGAIYEHWDLLDEALRTYEAAGGAARPELSAAMDLVFVRNGRRWAIR